MLRRAPRGPQQSSSIAAYGERTVRTYHLFPVPITSSRRQYSAYREEASQRRVRSKSQRTIVTRHGTEVSARRNRSLGELLRSFAGSVGRDRSKVLAALACATVGSVLELLPPAATKIAIDNVFGGAPLPEALRRWLPVRDAMLDDPSSLLALLALAIVALSLVAVVLSVTGRLLATRSVKSVQNRMRRRVLGHAMKLPLSRIHHIRAGGMVTALREDAAGVGDLVFSMLYNPWRAVIQLLGSLAVLGATDWRLLLGALLVLPVVVLSHRTWIGRIRPIYRDIKQTRESIDAHAAEVFGGMRIVRGFDRTRSEAIRAARSSHLMSRQEMFVWWWSRGIDLAWALFIPCASAALLWYGGTQVLRGTLTAGDLVLFLTYVMMLLLPIQMLASSATAFQTNLAGLDRLLDLLAEQPDMPDRPHAIRVAKQSIVGRVEIRDVSYRYPQTERAVLERISLRVEPGTTVALVGPSGSGKTTLCNLVARFFDPTEGSVLVDGTDLRDIQIRSWHRMLGIVEQDVFLFDGTVEDNVRYGAREASAAEVREAIERANAAEFIDEMPSGLQTRIGERGVRVSGGQRQRLAIARALLADPKILILDEATSSLDSESERLIQSALAQLLRDRTTFVIAHRLSTIQHADQIVVLEGGIITASGTHQQLMESSDRYRQMVLLQTAPPAAPKALGTPAAIPPRGASHLPSSVPSSSVAP
ncbi:MAG: ABC transporter ATP-binding protein [Planctomycetes bacterium]|nr:ABC transporter ATP-binding protein [Planctomycetota bacterium]